MEMLPVQVLGQVTFGVRRTYENRTAITRTVAGNRRNREYLVQTTLYPNQQNALSLLLEVLYYNIGRLIQYAIIPHGVIIRW